MIGGSQNRPMLFDLDGRERKLRLGIKKKNAPMGRGGVPPPITSRRDFVDFLKM